MPIPKIVVLTPVKNEAWILPRFLSVTSQFADLIIIADQMSSDGSREICGRYPNTVVIENPESEYNEMERQKLLIATARNLAPHPRLLLGLDADEILAADSITSLGWQRMLQAEPGTVLHFEKPDLVGGTDKCLRYRHGFWPLGFMDDGSPHVGKKIHSIRIPTPTGSPRLQVEGVRFLHYGLVRPRAQTAKLCLYAVLENLRKTSALRHRRANYSPSRFFEKLVPLEQTPNDWFLGWERAGIEMHDVGEQKLHWQHAEVLRLFGVYGTRRFWGEPIWDAEWSLLQKMAKASGFPGIPEPPLEPPPTSIKFACRIYDIICDALRWMFGLWRG